MSRNIWLASIMAVSALCSGITRADDISSLKEELADVRCKVAALESATMAPSGGGDAASLQTVKGKGSIQIGGDVNVDLIVKRRDDYTGAGREDDEVDSTEFRTNSANLRFKVSASQNAYMYLKLDLDDAWSDNNNNDGTLNIEQDDLIEEIKFVLNHVRGSNWGLVFGKGEVPYGQDKTLGVIQSYNHNDETYSSEGPVFMLAGSEATNTADAGNFHGNVGRTAHPGEVDNVFMAGFNYTYKNMLRFEFAVFQNNDSLNNAGQARGMHEDRSDDHLGFQSFALRLWAMPVEGLTLEASFIREYCDSAGDAALRTDLANGNWGEEAQYAMSLGFDYKMSKMPLEIFGEYQHGWDWGYTDGYSTDTLQLGVIWGALSNLDVGIMGEWLGIDDDNHKIEDDYYKMVLSAKYRFDSGLYMILEYGHEWFDRKAGNNQDDYSCGADMLAFRTGWAF